MNPPDKIIALVERFDCNIETYKRGKYNETELRREFIDPFFKTLGWDIDNEQGYAEAYKDVVHEDAIKIGQATKAPDYCFRIGGVRKFFLEAKKPSIDIKQDIHPAYQLRRYAWSAKLPLSIVTDFEEFAVYDCRIRPVQTDKAATARILYLTYKQYLQQWEEIANIFSRDAILKGSFDKYVASSKAKRGTAEVDTAFLQEIERWRELLARNIALRNTQLTQKELNFAVQRTIDRIIFLRICEDRGIETYSTLMALQNGTQVYQRLLKLFYGADDRYNSGLFHFKHEKNRSEESLDNLTPGLIIDDKVLKDIIKNLYYPDSPYEFSVLPADMLGQVYEQFLGKVIRLTSAHRAIVEYKPEVRKAGGVYYTPTYVVEYIVKQTVGKLVEGKNPGPRGAVSKLRILDPACGSGSFLLGAYQYLLDWHRDEYVKDDPTKWATGSNPRLYQSDTCEWKLTTDERKRILLNNIYGVDIDPQAVEVTKLSLLLKVLEGENEQTLSQQLAFFQQRALPDLSNNIKCGNSLIGTDFYEGRQAGFFNEEEVLRINAFDWEREFPEIFANGGFDAVIGNPPYDVLEKDRGKSSWPHQTLTDYAKFSNRFDASLGGKLNLFRFFIVQSINLIREKGKWGMIVPMALLADISCRITREFLITECNEINAQCFPQKDDMNNRVFRDAKLSTVVITSNVEISKSGSIIVIVHPGRKFEEMTKSCIFEKNDFKLIDPNNEPIPLMDQTDWKLCKKIYSNKDITYFSSISGVAINRGEINQTIYRKYIDDDPTRIKMLKGVEVGRYKINQKLSQGFREFFNEKKYLDAGNSFKKVSRIRRIATQRITGVDERLRVVATIIDPPAYFADSTNSLFISSESNFCLEFILGILNSKLIQWRFKLTSSNNNVGTNELSALPFPNIDLSDKKQKINHDNLINMVNKMLSLNQQLELSRTTQEKTIFQRQIDVTDRQIDQHVYQLYGLTEEEIRIVESACE